MKSYRNRLYRRHFICASFFLLFSVSLCAQADRIDSAIHKATSYFQARGTEIYPLILPLLVPVAEHYRLEINTGDRIKKDNLLLPLSRLFDAGWKNNFTAGWKKSDAPAEEILLQCLYCDQPDVTDSLAFRLNALYGNGMYELTHAYLGILFLKRNGCLTYRDKSVRKLEKKLQYALRKIMSEKDLSSDLRIEAMAFLLYGGSRKAVTQKQIDWLLQRQQPDGSWIDPERSEPWLVDHTTTLALWTLLEWKHNEYLLYLPGY